MRRRAWTPGFSSALRTYSSSASGLPLPDSLVQIQHAGGPRREVRVAGEDSRPVLRGLEHVSGQSAAHRGRRDRRRDTPGGSLAGQLGAAPPGQRRPGGGGKLARQRLNLGEAPGRELAGRPGHGASARPSRPYCQYRRRHLRAVSSQMPSRAAITQFAKPSAASSTIHVRITGRYPLRAPRRSRRRRPPWTIRTAAAKIRTRSRRGSQRRAGAGEGEYLNPGQHLIRHCGVPLCRRCLLTW